MYATDEVHETEQEHEEHHTPTLLADELAEELRTVLTLRAKARCRDGHGTLTHLFFSEELYDIARAKAICAKCPVSELCLDAALSRQEPWGVWGGQLLLNGRIVHHKRPRGRPPKCPRPELVVDEVPLPPYLATAG